MDNTDKIAILIKTFYRDEALYGCVESIKQYCRGIPYRLYIADDGEIDERKKAFYDGLRAEGHLVLELPENTGASRSRNLLVDELRDEQYVLRMDDDFFFGPSTDIAAMLHIMRNDGNVGVVADLEQQLGTGKGAFSGQISTWQGFMDIRDRKLYIRLTPLKAFKYRTVDGIRYAGCDFSRNMLLIRREALKEIKWDESLKFEGEHVDFLLQVKKSRWELVFTDASVHIHNEGIKFNSSFDKYRNVKRDNTRQAKDLLSSKWGFECRVIRRPVKDYIKAGFAKALRQIRLNY